MKGMRTGTKQGMRTGTKLSSVGGMLTDWPGAQPGMSSPNACASSCLQCLPQLGPGLLRERCAHLTPHNLCTLRCFHDSRRCPM